MARKDYVLIAGALREARPSMWAGEAARIAWLRVVAGVADALASDNPRFDRDRFAVACGASEEGE